MIDIARTNSVCGVGEVSDLSYMGDAKKALKDICGVRYDDYGDDDDYGYHNVGGEVFPFYYWGDKYNTIPRCGENLANYIIRQKIGSVFKSKTKKNPNSGNNIRCYIWTVDERKLKAWWKKNK